MTLAEKYPHPFCRRCERLGSQCSCAEEMPEENALIDGGDHG